MKYSYIKCIPETDQAFSGKAILEERVKKHNYINPEYSSAQIKNILGLLYSESQCHGEKSGEIALRRKGLKNLTNKCICEYNVQFLFGDKTAV